MKVETHLIINKDHEEGHRQFITFLATRFECLNEAPMPYEPETLAAWGLKFPEGSATRHIVRFVLWLDDQQLSNTMDVHGPEEPPGFEGVKTGNIQIARFPIGPLYWGAALREMTPKEVSAMFSVFMAFKTVKISTLEPNPGDVPIFQNSVNDLEN